MDLPPPPFPPPLHLHFRGDLKGARGGGGAYQNAGHFLTPVGCDPSASHPLHYAKSLPASSLPAPLSSPPGAPLPSADLPSFSSFPPPTCSPCSSPPPALSPGAVSFLPGPCHPPFLSSTPLQQVPHGSATREGHSSSWPQFGSPLPSPSSPFSSQSTCHRPFFPHPHNPSPISGVNSISLGDSPGPPPSAHTLSTADSAVTCRTPSVFPAPSSPFRLSQAKAFFPSVSQAHSLSDSFPYPPPRQLPSSHHVPQSENQKPWSTGSGRDEAAYCATSPAARLLPETYPSQKDTRARADLGTKVADGLLNSHHQDYDATSSQTSHAVGHESLLSYESLVSQSSVLPQRYKTETPHHQNSAFLYPEKNAPPVVPLRTVSHSAHDTYFSPSPSCSLPPPPTALSRPGPTDKSFARYPPVLLHPRTRQSSVEEQERQGSSASAKQNSHSSPWHDCSANETPQQADLGRLPYVRSMREKDKGGCHPERRENGPHRNARLGGDLPVSYPSTLADQESRGQTAGLGGEEAVFKPSSTTGEKPHDGDQGGVCNRRESPGDRQARESVFVSLRRPHSHASRLSVGSPPGVEEERNGAMLQVEGGRKEGVTHTSFSLFLPSSSAENHGPRERSSFLPSLLQGQSSVSCERQERSEQHSHLRPTLLTTGGAVSPSFSSSSSSSSAVTYFSASFTASSCSKERNSPCTQNPRLDISVPISARQSRDTEKAAHVTADRPSAIRAPTPKYDDGAPRLDDGSSSTPPVPSSTLGPPLLVLHSHPFASLQRTSTRDSYLSGTYQPRSGGEEGLSNSRCMTSTEPTGPQTFSRQGNEGESSFLTHGPSFALFQGSCSSPSLGESAATAFPPVRLMYEAHAPICGLVPSYSPHGAPRSSASETPSSSPPCVNNKQENTTAAGQGQSAGSVPQQESHPSGRQEGDIKSCVVNTERDQIQPVMGMHSFHGVLRDQMVGEAVNLRTDKTLMREGEQQRAQQRGATTDITQESMPGDRLASSLLQYGPSSGSTRTGAADIDGASKNPSSRPSSPPAFQGGGVLSEALETEKNQRHPGDRPVMPEFLLHRTAEPSDLADQHALLRNGLRESGEGGKGGDRGQDDSDATRVSCSPACSVSTASTATSELHRCQKDLCADDEQRLAKGVDSPPRPTPLHNFDQVKRNVFPSQHHQDYTRYSLKEAEHLCVLLSQGRHVPCCLPPALQEQKHSPPSCNDTAGAGTPGRKELECSCPHKNSLPRPFPAEDLSHLSQEPTTSQKEALPEDSVGNFYLAAAKTYPTSPVFSATETSRSPTFPVLPVAATRTTSRGSSTDESPLRVPVGSKGSIWRKAASCSSSLGENERPARGRGEDGRKDYPGHDSEKPLCSTGIPANDRADQEGAERDVAENASIHHVSAAQEEMVESGMMSLKRGRQGGKQRRVGEKTSSLLAERKEVGDNKESRQRAGGEEANRREEGHEDLLCEALNSSHKQQDISSLVQIAERDLANGREKTGNGGEPALGDRRNSQEAEQSESCRFFRSCRFAGLRGSRCRSSVGSPSTGREKEGTDASVKKKRTETPRDHDHHAEGLLGNGSSDCKHRDCSSLSTGSRVSAERAEKERNTNGPRAAKEGKSEAILPSSVSITKKTSLDGKKPAGGGRQTLSLSPPCKHMTESAYDEEADGEGTGLYAHGAHTPEENEVYVLVDGERRSDEERRGSTDRTEECRAALGRRKEEGEKKENGKRRVWRGRGSRRVKRIFVSRKQEAPQRRRQKDVGLASPGGSEDERKEEEDDDDSLSRVERRKPDEPEEEKRTTTIGDLLDRWGNESDDEEFALSSSSKDEDEEDEGETEEEGSIIDAVTPGRRSALLLKTGQKEEPLSLHPSTSMEEKKTDGGKDEDKRPSNQEGMSSRGTEHCRVESALLKDRPSIEARTRTHSGTSSSPHERDVFLLAEPKNGGKFFPGDSRQEESTRRGQRRGEGDGREEETGVVDGEQGEEGQRGGQGRGEDLWVVEYRTSARSSTFGSPTSTSVSASPPSLCSHSPSISSPALPESDSLDFPSASPPPPPALPPVGEVSSSSSSSSSPTSGFGLLLMQRLLAGDLSDMDGEDDSDFSLSEDHTEDEGEEEEEGVEDDEDEEYEEEVDPLTPLRFDSPTRGAYLGDRCEQVEKKERQGASVLGGDECGDSAGRLGKTAGVLKCKDTWSAEIDLGMLEVAPSQTNDPGLGSGLSSTPPRKERERKVTHAKSKAPSVPLSPRRETGEGIALFACPSPSSFASRKRDKSPEKPPATPDSGSNRSADAEVGEEKTGESLTRSKKRRVASRHSRDEGDGGSSADRVLPSDPAEQDCGHLPPPVGRPTSSSPPPSCASFTSYPQPGGVAHQGGRSDDSTGGSATTRGKTGRRVSGSALSSGVEKERGRRGVARRGTSRRRCRGYGHFYASPFCLQERCSTPSLASMFVSSSSPAPPPFPLHHVSHVVPQLLYAQDEGHPINRDEGGKDVECVGEPRGAGRERLGFLRTELKRHEEYRDGRRRQDRRSDQERRPFLNGFSASQIRHLKLQLDAYLQLLMQAAYVIRNKYSSSLPSSFCSTPRRIPSRTAHRPSAQVVQYLAGGPGVKTRTLPISYLLGDDKGAEKYGEINASEQEGECIDTTGKNLMKKVLLCCDQLLLKRTEQVNLLRYRKHLPPLQLQREELPSMSCYKHERLTPGDHASHPGGAASGSPGCLLKNLDDCTGLVPFPGPVEPTRTIDEGEAPRCSLLDIPLLRKIKQFLLLIEDEDPQYPRSMTEFLSLQTPFVDTALLASCWAGGGGHRSGGGGAGVGGRGGETRSTGGGLSAGGKSQAGTFPQGDSLLATNSRQTPEGDRLSGRTGGRRGEGEGKGGDTRSSSRTEEGTSQQSCSSFVVFTPAEDRLLGLGLARVGRRHFSFIREHFLPSKTESHINRRFKALQRRWQAAKDPRNPLAAWRRSLTVPFSLEEDLLLLSHLSSTHHLFVFPPPPPPPLPLQGHHSTVLSSGDRGRREQGRSFAGEETTTEEASKTRSGEHGGKTTLPDQSSAPASLRMSLHQPVSGSSSMHSAKTNSSSSSSCDCSVEDWLVFIARHNFHHRDVTSLQKRIRVLHRFSLRIASSSSSSSCSSGSFLLPTARGAGQGGADGEARGGSLSPSSLSRLLCSSSTPPPHVDFCRRLQVLRGSDCKKEEKERVTGLAACNSPAHHREPRWRSSAQESTGGEMPKPQCRYAGRERDEGQEEGERKQEEGRGCTTQDTRGEDQGNLVEKERSRQEGSSEEEKGGQRQREGEKEGDTSPSPCSRPGGVQKDSSQAPAQETHQTVDEAQNSSPVYRDCISSVSSPSHSGRPLYAVALQSSLGGGRRGSETKTQDVTPVLQESEEKEASVSPSRSVLPFLSPAPLTKWSSDGHHAAGKSGLQSLEPQKASSPVPGERAVWLPAASKPGVSAGPSWQGRLSQRRCHTAPRAALENASSSSSFEEEEEPRNEGPPPFLLGRGDLQSSSPAAHLTSYENRSAEPVTESSCVRKDKRENREGSNCLAREEEGRARFQVGGVCKHRVFVSPTCSESQETQRREEKKSEGRGDENPSQKGASREEDRSCGSSSSSYGSDRRGTGHVRCHQSSSSSSSSADLSRHALVQEHRERGAGPGGAFSVDRGSPERSVGQLQKLSSDGEWSPVQSAGAVDGSFSKLGSHEENGGKNGVGVTSAPPPHPPRRPPDEDLRLQPRQAACGEQIDTEGSFPPPSPPNTLESASTFRLLHQEAESPALSQSNLDENKRHDLPSLERMPGKNLDPPLEEMQSSSPPPFSLGNSQATSRGISGSECPAKAGVRKTCNSPDEQGNSGFPPSGLLAPQRSCREGEGQSCHSPATSLKVAVRTEKEVKNLSSSSSDLLRGGDRSKEERLERAEDEKKAQCGEKKVREEERANQNNTAEEGKKGRGQDEEEEKLAGKQGVEVQEEKVKHTTTRSTSATGEDLQEKKEDVEIEKKEEGAKAIEGGQCEDGKTKKTANLFKGLQKLKDENPICAPFYQDVTSIAEALDDIPCDFFVDSINCGIPPAMVFEPLAQAIVNCQCHMFLSKPTPVKIGDRIIRAKRTCPPSLRVKRQMTEMLVKRQLILAREREKRERESSLAAGLLEQHQQTYWRLCQPLQKTHVPSSDLSLLPTRNSCEPTENNPTTTATSTTPFFLPSSSSSCVALSSSGATHEEANRIDLSSSFCMKKTLLSLHLDPCSSSSTSSSSSPPYPCPVYSIRSQDNMDGNEVFVYGNEGGHSSPRVRSLPLQCRKSFSPTFPPSSCATSLHPLPQRPPHPSAPPSKEGEKDTRSTFASPCSPPRPSLPPCSPPPLESRHASSLGDGNNTTEVSSDTSLGGVRATASVDLRSSLSGKKESDSLSALVQSTTHPTLTPVVVPSCPSSSGFSYCSADRPEPVHEGKRNTSFSVSLGGEKRSLATPEGGRVLETAPGCQRAEKGEEEQVEGKEALFQLKKDKKEEVLDRGSQRREKSLAEEKEVLDDVEWKGGIHSVGPSGGQESCSLPGTREGELVFSEGQEKSKEEEERMIVHDGLRSRDSATVLEDLIISSILLKEMVGEGGGGGRTKGGKKSLLPVYLHPGRREEKTPFH